MKTETIAIIYPESRNVTAPQVILWAKDAIANHSRTEDPETLTLEDAIFILEDEGEVTFRK